MPEVIDGTIVLSPHVICDGAMSTVEGENMIRIQSHYHTDHLNDFSDSRTWQDEIWMMQETRDLLEVMKNYRGIRNWEGIQTIKPDKTFDYHGEKIKVLPNGHTIGSCQIQVKRTDGVMVGYSGDFFWELQETIKVDKLVIDASCNPGIERKYSSEDSVTALCEKVNKTLNLKRPIILHAAHRSLLAKCVHHINLYSKEPIVYAASKAIIDEFAVFEKWNYNIPGNIVDIKDMTEYAKIRNSGGPYILLTTDLSNVWADKSLTITCNRLLSNEESPITIHKDNINNVNICMSEHSDLEGTIEYIVETGAREILIDSSRSQSEHKAMDLRDILMANIAGVKIEYSRNNQPG